MSPHLERLSVVIPGLAVAGSIMYWAITSANTASQTALALTQFHAEIIARFDKIDGKIEGLPVLAERVLEVQQQLVGAQGGYASLALRLNAVENNNAAIHTEAETALKRTR